MPRKILIIGATSAIAQATAKQFAALGDELFLIGRNQSHLAQVTTDLNICFNRHYQFAVADLNDLPQHQALLTQAIQQLGGLDVVLIAYGSLSNQTSCESSVDETVKELTTNCLSIISLLVPISHYFEQQRYGCIAVITSVAGDRGRKSNYVYATAKAAVGTYLQGLRNRLYPANVKVITIKPGFIDTPMTKDFEKGIIWAQPETVAKDIIRGIEQKRDIIYSPYFWRWIMLGIRLIPERIFKRLCL